MIFKSVSNDTDNSTCDHLIRNNDNALQSKLMWASLVFCAHDLSLCANEPSQLKTMLNRLVWYARSMHLIINIGRSEVVHFNSKANSSSLPVFYINGSPLVCMDSFKYLGMIFDKNVNLVVAADVVVQP